MKLVASAIVRNEADRYLGVWLNHLLTFCDEVRLLDDGSEDSTADIAAMRFPEVRICPNPGPSFFEDESAARNALLQWTHQGEPTHVLAIDADEFIGDAVALRACVLENPAPVYSLWMREVWKLADDQHGEGWVGLRIDGLWGDRRCPLLWQAPPRLQGRRWQIPRRKLACGREPQGVRSQRGVDTGVGIYHFGWARVAEREARAERYYEHDGGRFHADRHLQSLLDPDERVTLDWQPWPTSIPGDAATRATRP
jgi:hypothetical protein